MGPTILIVDDADLRDTIVALIETFGYATLTAGDAEAALKLIESDRPIDLLFADVALPGKLNGVKIAQRAIKQRPGLRVAVDHRLQRRSGSNQRNYSLAGI